MFAARALCFTNFIFSISTGKLKNQQDSTPTKSPFATELGNLLDNFCEPIATDVTETTSNETVQEAKKNETARFRGDKTEMVNKRKSISDQENDAPDRKKVTKLTNENEYDRSYSVEDVRNCRTGSTARQTSDFYDVSDYSDTDDNTISPHASPPLKSPRDRMCLDHFQMVYGSVSYKSPQSPGLDGDDEDTDDDK